MARSEFQIGDRIGAYELVAHVGSGGFASVWQARRKGPGGFEVQVALKLTRTSLANDPLFEAMFIDEAKVAALIDHPNVVKIFELGTEGSTLFMAMEFVRGQPLSTLRNMAERDKRRIPVPMVMKILAETCAGLHAAHELTRDGRPLSVIHRDVSPENILVSDAGVVKLIDFGIAKAQDRLATDTATGIAKGKLRYMSPEQATAKPVDRRADIWAVGAVGFDVLMGHPVFDAPNDVARLMALVGTGPVPPLDPSIPRAYAAIIERALSRRVEDRYPTAAAMRAAIEAALEENGEHVTPDALVTFFGDWLGPEQPAPISSLAEIRARFAGRPTDDTTDLGRAAATGLAVPPSETLGALDSSLAAAGLAARPWWRSTAAAALVVATGTALAFWIGLRSPAALAPPASASAPSANSADAAANASVIAEVPGPSAASATAAATSTIANVEPVPGTVNVGRNDGELPRAPAGSASSIRSKRAPASPTKKTKPASSARPRYDDTIQ